MRESSIVRARVDPRIKSEATVEPLVPNDETIEAMKAARRDALITAGPANELLAKLNGCD